MSSLIQAALSIRLLSRSLTRSFVWPVKKSSLGKAPWSLSAQLSNTTSYHPSSSLSKATPSASLSTTGLVTTLTTKFAPSISQSCQKDGLTPWSSATTSSNNISRCSTMKKIESAFMTLEFEISLLYLLQRYTLFEKNLSEFIKLIYTTLKKIKKFLKTTTKSYISK